MVGRQLGDRGRLGAGRIRRRRLGHAALRRDSANQQPAVAVYVKRAGDTEYRPLAVDVLRIEDGVVGEITVFTLEEKLLEALGLPPRL